MILYTAYVRVHGAKINIVGLSVFASVQITLFCPVPFFHMTTSGLIRTLFVSTSGFNKFTLITRFWTEFLSFFNGILFVSPLRTFSVHLSNI